MEIYRPEEKLQLTEQVGLTKEVYEILRKEKQKQKLSMAKIVCNAIIQLYAIRSSTNSKHAGRTPETHGKEAPASSDQDTR